MKRTLFLILAISALSLAAAAQDKAPAPAAGPSKAQTTCPVSGEPVDKADSPHIDYEGQRIYFCCDKCPVKFKADPEKYFARIAEQGVLLENVQKTCPVSGEPLEDHDSFADYKGRRVYFCCPKCEKAFKADPAKYLASLPGEQAQASAPKG